VTQIRRATRADAEGIARVHVASWQAAYAGLLPNDFLAGLHWTDRCEGWRARLQDRDSRARTWVGVDETDDVVGWATDGPARDADRAGADQWELYAINVAPMWWGRGVGGRLMARSLSELPTDVADVSLWVLDGNVRARHFYERLGFAPDGVTKSDVIGGRDVVEVRYLR
jgi:GNAT superfamily N-acetyltransferase